MTFKNALQKLGIEEYSERIFNSNSHGELFHLHDYFVIAESLSEEGAKEFPKWFQAIVKQAEEKWERPESVFQHIGKLFQNGLSEHKKLTES